MTAFEYDRSGSFSVPAVPFSFRSETPEPGLFELTCGAMKIRSIPAVPGDYPETQGLLKKRRVHLSEDGTEFSLETESSIPFGAEPVIRRTFVFRDGRMSVRTDFILRHSFELRNLAGGGFRAEGVKHFRITQKGPRAGAPVHGKAVDFASRKEGEVIYDKDQAPLLLHLTGVDGRSVEFELGASIWRWDLPSRLPGRARFMIRREGAALLFLWNLYEFTEPEPGVPPPHGRNLRMTWALRYAEPEEPPAEREFIFDSVHYDWPESARVHDRDSAVLDLPCFQSDRVLEILKAWLRSHLTEAKEGDRFVLLVPPEDSVCFDASHEARPKKGTLLHWDRDGKYEFQRWAARQLARKGASLILRTAEPEKKN